MRYLQKFGRQLINAVVIGCLFTAALPTFSTELKARNGGSVAKDGLFQTPRRDRLADTTLSFEANQGQCDSAVKFMSRAEGHIVYLTAKGAVMQLGGASRSQHGGKTTNDRDSL